jgi:hypothetical protein
MTINHSHFRWTRIGVHTSPHLALNMDRPESREIRGAEAGRIIEVPEVGGLHHHYERRAA